MEKTGDPVIDYIDEVRLYAERHHINWIFLFPDAFNTNYSGEEQRLMLRDMRDKCIGCPASHPDAPEPPDAVKLFIDGGPRPPIIG